MNFFKSILSDDPDPPNPAKSDQSEPYSPSNPSERSDDENDVVDIGPNQNPSPNNANSSAETGTSSTTTATTSVGGWSFGGLMKTFATRSESVLETYRRDLQEFGSGLRNETQLFRDVASRAVKDLPASIEVGASVAHGSLESVTHALDGVIKSTAEIISHGKETVVSSSDVELETPDTSRFSGSCMYNRFDAQLSAIQNDINTFSEEPEDLEDYKEWKSGFALEEKSEEVEKLIGENGVLEGVYKRVVPNVVDDETFWCRYFFRVHKLKQQENVRANLVKRAISVDDEEELTWDVDDNGDDLTEKNVQLKGEELEKKALNEQSSPPVPNLGNTSDERQSSSSAAVNDNEEDKSTVDSVVNDDVLVKLSEVRVCDEKAKLGESSRVKNEEKQDETVMKEEKLVEEDNKARSEAKVDHGESSKDSDVSVVSSQQSLHEEDDMGWDEIENIGSADEMKGNPIAQGGSPNRAGLRKRLSAAEEDEDLSWDIEDDD